MSVTKSGSPRQRKSSGATASTCEQHTAATPSEPSRDPGEVAYLQDYQAIRFMIGIDYALLIIDKARLDVARAGVPEGDECQKAFAARVSQMLAMLLKQFGKIPVDTKPDPETVRLMVLAFVEVPYQPQGQNASSTTGKQRGARPLTKRPANG